MTIKNFMNIVDGKKTLNECSTMECGDMATTVSPAPATPPVSMNLNFTAQGVEGVKEILNLISKVDAAEPVAPQKSVVSAPTVDPVDDIIKKAGLPPAGKEIVYGDEEPGAEEYEEEGPSDIEVLKTGHGILDSDDDMEEGLGGVLATIGKKVARWATKAAGYAAGYHAGGPVGAPQGYNVGKTAGAAAIPGQVEPRGTNKRFGMLDKFMSDDFDYDASDATEYTDGVLSAPGGLNRPKMQYKKEYPGDNNMNSIHTENANTIKDRLIREYRNS